MKLGLMDKPVPVEDCWEYKYKYKYKLQIEMQIQIQIWNWVWWTNLYLWQTVENGQQLRVSFHSCIITLPSICLLTIVDQKLEN